MVVTSVTENEAIVRYSHLGRHTNASHHDLAWFCEIAADSGFRGFQGILPLSLNLKKKGEMNAAAKELNQNINEFKKEIKIIASHQT